MQTISILIPLQQYHIQADLYLNTRTHPIVIMAHGLGGEKSCGLDLYVQEYIRQGYSVCCFDHRGFGQSTGKYKNLVDDKSQIQDWQTVIDYLKQKNSIDEKDMILWGYSFSGAHVLTLASKKKYRAVIANFPHVDGIASLAGYPIHYMIPATCLAITDIIYNLFGKVKNIKVVAKNRFAVLSGNDCYNGYYSLIPQNQNWDNQVPARIMATIALYRPITVAHKIESPTLIIGAIKDSLIPISKTRATANKSSYIQYAEYNCGHFDLFHEPFMTRIKTQHQKFLGNISNL